MEELLELGHDIIAIMTGLFCVLGVIAVMVYMILIRMR